MIKILELLFRAFIGEKLQKMFWLASRNVYLFGILVMIILLIFLQIWRGIKGLEYLTTGLLSSWILIKYHITSIMRRAI